MNNYLISEDPAARPEPMFEGSNLYRR